MKSITLLSLILFCVSVSAAEKKAAPKKPATPPAKKAATSTAPKSSKEWPLIECGSDLKTLSQNIDAYQKKLAAAGDPLPLKARQGLYNGDSVFAESLTLLAPQVFWKDIIASRTSFGCHNRFKNLKSSLQTNDTKGTPPKLAAWNQCVMAQYGTHLRQTKQINGCIQQGLKKITNQQNAKKSKS